jgi:hypothetical protein
LTIFAFHRRNLAELSHNGSRNRRQQIRERAMGRWRVIRRLRLQGRRGFQESANAALYQAHVPKQLSACHLGGRGTAAGNQEHMQSEGNKPLSSLVCGSEGEVDSTSRDRFREQVNNGFSVSV